MKYFYFSLIFATSFLFSQSGVAAIFLTIEPSPEMHGMGGIGVALPSQDLAAQYYNPANGLVQRRGLNIAGARMETPWLPELATDMTLSYHTIGANLTPSYWPLQIGVAWSRARLDLGMQEKTDENGNLIDHFRSDMWAEGVLVAAAGEFNLWSVPLAISIGFKEKDVHQDFADSHSSKNTFTDFGFILSAPFAGEVNSADLNFNSWEFTPSIGYSKNNVGREIQVSNSLVADPGPRNARLGISITSRITAPNGLEFLGLKFGRAALDYLPVIPMYEEPPVNHSITYQPGLGDIDFIKHVILGQGDENVATSTGAELRLFGMIAFRRGSTESEDWLDKEKTEGYTVYIDDILRTYGYYMDNPFLSKLGDHLTISYSYSIISSSVYTVIENQDFSQFTIGIKNLEDLFKK